jgi:hypothetical protein
MHLGDLVGAAWFLIVIAGVVSSVVRSVRRASQSGQNPQARQQFVQQPPARGVHAQFATGAVVPAQAPAPAAAPAPVPPPVPPQAARQPAPRAIAPRVLHQAAAPVAPAPAAAQSWSMPVEAPAPKLAFGRFRTRHELVRAVVGAEILGKPKALRDEYDLLA